MECNKDEAARAKEVAERKFTEKDIVGAKKFVLKAQRLYPTLEGLSQMLATIEVYIAAETKVSGESDWYGILGLNSCSDDETARKQYKKLALMLHPDKNKSIGADGAFKLVSEAWGLLSDKTRRVPYDQRRFGKPTQQKAPPASSGMSAPPAANSFYNFKNSTSSNLRPPMTSIPVGPTAGPQHPRSSPNTFVAFCTNCHCPNVYESSSVTKSRLMCGHCREPFTLEIQASPKNGCNVYNVNKLPPDMNAYAQGRNMGAVPNVDPTGFTSRGTTFPSGSFSTMAGTGTATASASYAAYGNTAQQVYEKAKMEREAAQAAIRQETLIRRKRRASKKMSSASGVSATGCSPDVKGGKTLKRKRDATGENEYAVNMGSQMGVRNGELQSKQGGLGREKISDFSTGGKSNSTRDLSPLETRNMLVQKAKMEIGKMLKKWSTPASARARENEITTDKENVKDAEKILINGDTYSQRKTSIQMDWKNEVLEKKGSDKVPAVDLDAKSHEPTIDPNAESREPTVDLNAKACEPTVDLDAEAGEPILMNVPDPDFHDFDMDRLESSFGGNQVWAVYDDDDGMPRYYAMIHSVTSLNPFKMRIGWLNSKSNSELGPLTWIKSGFPKTCGDFRVGKYETYNTLNSFSHRVRWTKGIRGSIQIYPTKGDVWALYHNWSPDWNEHTPDEVIHKYDMVEVIDDYNEEQGVSVTPVIKVVGFRTVFRQHSDAQMVQRIPREQMFRFSHQVPSYLLTGRESESAPQGCLELDPAATPLELLQVMTEAREQDTVEVMRTASQQVAC
ncbi:hypothetical protein IFM89_036891 [Coptis chinensis]|uniref:J domain-containing protein n=1 Tax=Coptis chinensis TaxID=261450 RepID=A0A835HYN4_9MAGN|nr:hypothetical protein IFM89_036891 [Coptis chinensis]